MDNKENKESLGDMLAKRKATADREAEARRIEAERYLLSKTRQQRRVLEDQFAPLFEEEDGVFRIDPPVDAYTVRGYGNSRWTGPFSVEITARHIQVCRRHLPPLQTRVCFRRPVEGRNCQWNRTRQ